MTTVVLVQQGGTGSNNAADARASLGAAPSAAYDQANSAFAQANAAIATANNGNSGANAAYAQANAAYDQANSAFAQANLARSDANTTFAAVNVTFGTVNTSITNAHNQANTATIIGQNAYAQANLAYAASNNSNLLLGGLVSGTLNVSQDLIVGGNIYLEGNTTYINVSTYSIEDSLVYYASNNKLTDSVDIGFMGGKNTSGTYAHTGLVRDATDGKWKLFDGLAEEGHIGNVIDFANTSLATLVANVQANTLTVVNGVSGNVNFDSGTLFVDSVSNRVGVGVSSPTAQLDVAGTSSSGYSLLLRSGDVDVGTDSTQIAFSFNNGVNYRHSIRTRHSSSGASNNAIDFWLWNTADAATTLGSTRVMTIEGTGNVGIGTANPTSNLHIVGTANITSNVIVDGGTLFVNAVANNVGIGTNSPTKTLEIGLLGTFRMQTGSVFMDCTPTAGATDSFIWNTSANAIYSWQMNSSERMRIAANGYVGIGTTSPAGIIHVRYDAGASDNYTGKHIFQTTDQRLTIGTYWQSGVGQYATIQSESASAVVQSLLLNPSGGNVGIGTSSPATKLTVSSGVNAGLLVTDGTVNTIVYNSTGNVSSIGTTTNHSLDFYTNNSQRMRITNGGFVGIGTTSPGRLLSVHGTSEWPIQVRGASDTTTNRMSVILMQRARGSLASPTVPTSGTNLGGIEIGGYNTSTYTEGYNGGAAIFAFADGTWTSTSNPTYLSFYTNASGAAGATERVRISAAGGFSVGTTADPGAGAIYATGNITAYYSDARLKEFRGRIKNALDKVSKLNGYYYVENEVAAQYGYTNKEEQVGVSAQEVEAVLPHVVAKAPFDIAQDENGNQYSVSGEDYKTVRYERLVPLLIEAIKELKAEIEVLKQK